MPTGQSLSGQNSQRPTREMSSCQSRHTPGNKVNITHLRTYKRAGFGPTVGGSVNGPRRPSVMKKDEFLFKALAMIVSLAFLYGINHALLRKLKDN